MYLQQHGLPWLLHRHRVLGLPKPSRPAKAQHGSNPRLPPPGALNPPPKPLLPPSQQGTGAPARLQPRLLASCRDSRSPLVLSLPLKFPPQVRATCGQATQAKMGCHVEELLNDCNRARLMTMRNKKTFQCNYELKCLDHEQDGRRCA